MSHSARRRLAAAAIALAVATLSACSGYRVVRTSEGLGPVRRVAVLTLGNYSIEPGLELMVTDALRREFGRRGGVELVSDPADADLVISGTVRELQVNARSFSSIAFALEYQILMQIALEARRSDGTPVGIDPTAMRDFELYLTSADVEAERRNRDEALRRLSSLMASRVGDSIAEQLAR
jgi:hypothetical protein